MFRIRARMMADFYDPPEHFEAVVTCRDLVLYVPPDPEPPTLADDVPTSALAKLSVLSVQSNDEGSGESELEEEYDDGITFEEALKNEFRKFEGVIDSDMLKKLIEQEQKDEDAAARLEGNVEEGYTELDERLMLNRGPEGVNFVDTLKVHRPVNRPFIQWNNAALYLPDENENRNRNNRRFVPNCGDEIAGEARVNLLKGLRTHNRKEFLRELLNWDYHNEVGPLKPQSSIPASFGSTLDYKQTFKPFVFTELWSGIESQKGMHWKDQRSPLKCIFKGTFSSDNDPTSKSLNLRLDLLSARKLEDFEVSAGNLVLVGHAVKNRFGKFEMDGDDDYSMGRIESCNGSSIKDSDIIRYLDIEISVPVNSRIDPDVRIDRNNPDKEIAFMHILNLESTISAEREFNAVNSIEAYDSVQSILQANVSVIPDNKELTEMYQEKLNLTPAQAKAVTRAAHGRGFQMIQGPPGTGKTKTIVSLIRAICSNAKKNPICRCTGKILVCAPSNAAVDEIVSRLVPGLDDLEGAPMSLKVLRLGNMEKIPLGNRSCTLESKVIDHLLSNRGIDAETASLAKECDKLLNSLTMGETLGKKLSFLFGVKNGNHVVKFKKNKRGGWRRGAAHRALLSEIDDCKKQFKAAGKKFRDAKKKIMALTEDLQKQFIKEADVICTTLSHSGSVMIGQSVSCFDTIIIDEAAQATEPTTLIPLQHVHRRCVMVGDPKQLPPTVKDRRSVKMNYGQSLFSRIYSHCKDIPGAITMLDVQFRMHPEISSFPSDIFYDSKLMNSTEEYKPFEKTWHHKNGALAPYSFFHVTSTHTRLGSSSINNKEISVVFDLFNYLITHYDDVGSVGVISPYKAHNTAMENFFKSKLPDEAMQKIAFNSVDGFQGQEKDVIIFSCVRGGTQGIGFLRDVRRLNVAITRAKSSLWIVGNSSTLLSDFTWSRLILNCQSRSCFHNLHRHDLWTYLRTRTRQPPGRDPRRAAVEGTARRNRIYYD